MMLNNITVVLMLYFLFRPPKARMDKGDIKKKTSSLTIVMQAVMSPFMNWPVNKVKDYMEWSANYFRYYSTRWHEYRYNAERKNQNMWLTTFSVA